MIPIPKIVTPQFQRAIYQRHESMPTLHIPDRAGQFLKIMILCLITLNIVPTIHSVQAQAEPTDPSTIRINDFTISPSQTVEVAVEGFNLENLGVAVFNVTYDPEILSVVECSFPPDVMFASAFCNAEYAPNEIRFILISPTGTSGDMQMGTIIFQSHNIQSDNTTSTDSLLGIDISTFVDVFTSDSAVNTVDGTVTILNKVDPTLMSTSTPTLTPVPTNTLAPTATDTPTPTATSTNTQTPTSIPTLTPISTETETSTPTPTLTPTNTPTPTATSTDTLPPTPTLTPSLTPAATLTVTNTPTETQIPTPTLTLIPTLTPTRTYTPTPIPTDTPRPTITPTLSPFPTPINVRGPDGTSGPLYNTYLPVILR